MEFLDLTLLVNWLGLAGIAVFAVSGALDAARNEMDILGFMLIGTVTGLGGGTARDLLLGRSPVYWVEEPIYVGICLVVTTITYFVVPYIASRTRALVWMDALGISLFCVTGTQIAHGLGVSPLISVCMGVMTATFGGITRDVLCRESLMLGQRELYVTTTVLGASVYLLLQWLSLPQYIAVLGGFSTAFALRSAAILFDLRLPSYHTSK
ncbi:trimeric intracellular cation channel family protein [Motiliproteus sp. MSK22-1]|uniref:trimeric intracellular cation channel family protein n=1 Tax=Motiliproteus sp. MSK22-1 TaxID=1897630 RepID=UPI0009FB051B|nr:trimeric intracellular cation channel family protein [Motiliproteus sp. MSK22-1]